VSNPTTKHKSGWSENLGSENHSSGGGSPTGSSRCSYKIVRGRANPYILGENTLPMRYCLLAVFSFAAVEGFKDFIRHDEADPLWSVAVLGFSRLVGHGSRYVTITFK